MFDTRRIGECPVALATVGAVVFDNEVYDELLYAVRAYHNEFMVFLEGQRNNLIVAVKGYYVPRQEVTATSCEAKELFDPSRWVGIAHSHHDMGAFHSSIDQNGVDNAAVSVVMSAHGNWSAKLATQLPCGKLGVVNANVSTELYETPTFVLAPGGRGDCPYPTPPCGVRVYSIMEVLYERCRSQRPIVSLWSNENVPAWLRL